MAAKINYEFYNNKDIYNDGKVEDELFSKYKYNKEINKENDEIFYLTTNIRENVISWYPFKEKSNVLEVGAGVGTITGKLCDLCERVTSVEGSKRRADVLFERHKDRDNLEIFVGNFEDINFNDKFDYIVLIGVLEYSKIFFEDNEPFKYFLIKLKKLLKKNGKIIIAIENRYGIKYWAGNREDHIGIPYQGLYGYENRDIQTFGKNELITLLKSCGLKNQKYYSCFPDYKMPQLIFSENYDLEIGELESMPIYNYGQENYSFNPRKVLKGLQDNKMLNDFSNSFIIETTPFDCEPCDIEYVKFQPNRTDKYNTITIIKKNDNILKRANRKEAKEHLKNIELIQKKLKDNFVPINDVKFIEDELLISKVEGCSVEELLLKNSNNKEKFLEIFDGYVEFVKKMCVMKVINKLLDEKEKLIYKKNKIKVLKVGLLDFNLSNTYYYKGKYTLIDQEWCTTYDIPLDYVVYFSIKLLFEKTDYVFGTIDEKELYERYNIDSKKMKCFNNMSEKFFNKLNNVNDFNTFKKIKEKNHIIVNENIKNLENDLEFYTNLVYKQRDDYEIEINNLNDLIHKQRDDYENEINNLNDLIHKQRDDYENEIVRINKIELKYDRLLNNRIIRFYIKICEKLNRKMR